jgi:ABC-2 type transport system permease protein
MRHALGVYRRLLGVQVRSQMAYRAAFLSELLAAGVVTLLEFASIALVFGRFEQLGGWSLGEVAFLYGLVEGSFGLMDLLFSGFDPQGFGLAVRRGTLDQLFLRPVPIGVQVMGSQLQLRRLGKVALGAAIFAGALRLVEVQWTAGKLAYLPLVVLGMVAFFGGLFVAGATLTFWTVESIEAVNILTYGGSYMVAFPMTIYQDWLRSFFTFVLPAIFLNYYPALYFLDKPDPFGFPSFAPFLAPAAGAAVLLASLAFWRFGLRHYQSTGT